MRRIPLMIAASSLALLVGCASAPRPQPLYAWYGYETQLDQWFRQTSTSPDVQLQSMQKDLQRMQSAGQRVPPGFRAHIGLLHGQMGDLVSMRSMLEAEKAAFPESAAYMDFLLRNFKKK